MTHDNVFIGRQHVTVVSVDFPNIQTNLGFSPSSLAWVVNAYLIERT